MKKLLLLLALLVPASVQAATYWVSQSASGQHCVNSASDPGNGSSSQTIAQGVACMAGGDTVIIKAGTYSETGHSINIPSGSSLSSGATTIKAQTAGTVTLSSANPFNFYDGNFRYVIMDGLTWSGTEVAFAGTNPADHIRFTNFLVTGSPTNGFLLGGTGSNEFITGTITASGTDNQNHGIYMGSANNLVDHVSISAMTGYCIQIYKSPPTALDNNILRYNTFSGCHTADPRAEVTVYYGDNNQIYGNIFKNGSGANGAIAIGTASTTNLKIYNNTISNYSGACFYSDNTSPGTVEFKNNICSNTTGIVNAGSGTVTYATNLCTSAGTGCAFNEAASTTFITPGSDFHIKTGSAAINQGTNLGSSYSPDIANVARPTSGPWEIGAYEFGTPFVPGPVTDNFDRANGALGANWSGSYSGFTNGTIVTNKVRGTTLSSNMVQVYAAPVGLTQAPTVILSTIGAGLSGDGGLLLRASPTPTSTFYYIAATQGAASTTYIYRCVTGTCTPIANDPSQTWASGDTLKATIADTSGLITVYKNDVSFMTYTDGTPLTGTRTGISSYSANALGDIELDDFYVGGTPIPDITGRIVKIQSGQTLKLGQQ